MIKNVRCVTIPNSGGMTGIEAACILGAKDPLWLPVSSLYWLISSLKVTAWLESSSLAAAHCSLVAALVQGQAYMARALQWWQRKSEIWQQRVLPQQARQQR